MSGLRGVLIVLFVSSACAPASAAVRFSDMLGIARVLATTYQHFVAEPALLKRLESAQVRDREIQEEYDAGFMTAREVEAARKNLATQGRIEYVTTQTVDKGLATLGELMATRTDQSLQRASVVVPFLNLGEYEGTRLKERRLVRYLMSLAEILLWVIRMRLPGGGSGIQFSSKMMDERRCMLDRLRHLLLVSGQLVLVGKNSPRTMLAILLHFAFFAQSLGAESAAHPPHMVDSLPLACDICTKNFDSWACLPVRYGGCSHITCLTCATTPKKHGYSGGDVPFSCVFCRAPYSSVVQVKAKSVEATGAADDQPFDVRAATKSAQIRSIKMRIDGLNTRLREEGLPGSEKAKLEDMRDELRRELAALGGSEGDAHGS